LPVSRSSRSIGATNNKGHDLAVVMNWYDKPCRDELLFVAFQTPQLGGEKSVSRIPPETKVSSSLKAQMPREEDGVKI
jgi:hypothetical protein